jgi:ATPase subunit of ABC transporter with duplicated ATPase domains
MQKLSQPFITLTDVSYEKERGIFLFRHLGASFGAERVGFVGQNGIGKTTLLRIAVGELDPAFGTVTRQGKIAYLPQDAAASDQQVTDISDALGFGTEFLGVPFTSLSGGERMKASLAKLLAGKPDMLVLDEPTNNLDRESREFVYELIRTWSGGLLVVSHDRELLNLMDRIVELSPLGLKTYGGNYDFYHAQRHTEHAAAERHISDTRKELKKAERQAHTVKERHEKRMRRGKALRPDIGIGKAGLNQMRNTAERTQAHLSVVHETQVHDAAARLAAAKARIAPTNTITIDLPKTEVPNRKLVAELTDVRFGYPRKNELFSGLSLSLYGPERISIEGPNGSGKTTLAKLLLGELLPTSGTVRHGVHDVAYLDQEVAVLDPDRSLLQHLTEVFTEQQARLWLSRFLVFGHDVTKPVRSLSGGERVRAAFACAVAGPRPPQLIVLDEPTNNLDLDSIEQLESALANYRGAMIVISHDRAFLDNIGIERVIRLE